MANGLHLYSILIFYLNGQNLPLIHLFTHSCTVLKDTSTYRQEEPQIEPSNPAITTTC